MPERGLEPLHLAACAPEAHVATNYTIPAMATSVAGFMKKGSGGEMRDSILTESVQVADIFLRFTRKISGNLFSSHVIVLRHCYFIAHEQKTPTHLCELFFVLVGDEGLEPPTFPV